MLSQRHTAGKWQRETRFKPKQSSSRAYILNSYILNYDSILPLCILFHNLFFFLTEISVYTVMGILSRSIVQYILVKASNNHNQEIDYFRQKYSQLLATTDLISALTVLPFLEFHMNVWSFNVWPFVFVLSHLAQCFSGSCILLSILVVQGFFKKSLNNISLYGQTTIFILFTS